MRTVATPNRRTRRVGLLALTAAVIALGVTLMPMTAGAVHGGPFELDGNALDSNGNGAPPDDWGTLFPTDNSSTDLGHSFVTDKGETGDEPDDGYGSGLTKDTQDVPNWSAVTGAISPEKDDILHAYASTYVSGGDQLLYFGQDRAPKPNGSTSMGFWFFQDQVGPDGAGGFTGAHRNGDVLVTSDMTNGGSVSVVNIFRWQNGGLVSVASLANAECGDSLPPAIDALACGKANEDGPIDVPWNYPADQVPQNIFFEGGINLSNLFEDQTIPCFSSFLANTRTSPSETADLKDFVAGNLDTCGTITIHKDAIPKSAQTFSYDTTGATISDFQLADPTAGEDASQTKVFTGLQPGSYSVAEVELALGWTNTGLTCTTEGPGTSVQKSGGDSGRAASIALGLAGNVDCTFSNTFVKQNPSVATDIHNSDHQAVTSAPIGSTVHDKATVSGVPGFASPTGNVSFTVYMGNTQCEGQGTAAGLVALSGGVAHPSNDATVPVGGLSYKAHYGGDSIYNAADGPCETLAATKLDSTTATDVHDAGHQVITHAPIGSTVHDKATVSGALTTPTGTVDFTVYMGNAQCEGQGAAAGSVALSDGVAHPSNPASVPVGGLSYRAQYSGDDTYNPSTGPCEPLAGDKLDSSTATDVHNADHEVVTHMPIGSSVHDKATVSGALTTPTGAVDFTVFMGNTHCEGERVAAGSVALSGGVAHPSNDATVPVGGLSYRARYSGDDTYNPSTGPCEPLAGDKLDSSTATDVHNADHEVVTRAPIGSSVHDKATVSGALTIPTGDVSFRVYLGNTQCEGAGETAGSVALSGGIAHPSDIATVPVGGLSYRAHYNGDDTYNPSTGPCEQLAGHKLDSSTLTDIHLGTGNADAADATPITSAPIGSTVHDKARVSGALGVPTGAVSFTVYMGNTQCEGDGAAAGSVALSGGVAHPSNDATVPVGGLSYRAHYGGDDTYNPSTGPCEPLEAGKLDSSTATDVHNAGHEVITHAPIGSSVHDKATVSGALTIPTGTVDFTVFLGNTDCEGVGVAAGSVPLSGGVAHPSDTAVVPVGGLSYRAHYGGDHTYKPSTGPCEPLAGDKLASWTATDVHNAGHDVVTSAPIGSSVHDKATVSGPLTTPTGTVDFTVFLGDTDCEGEGVPAGSVALSGGVAHPSNEATVPVGGLSYRAHYSGDDTYNPSTGPCEPLHDLKARLTVKKDFVSAPADATVTLRIRHGEAIEESAQKGDGGSISKVLAPGTYTAEEISGDGDVNLALYNSSIECVENGGGVVAPSAPGTSAAVSLANGDDITCTITNRHVLPLISVSKTPSPSVLQEPGGNVTYTIVVTNASSVDPIAITSLVDDRFGDITAECGIPGAKWQLAPLAAATCSITRPVSGNAGSSHTNTVTASGRDEGGNQAQAQASATVTFTAAPPPPPPPPLIDLAVTKVDTPDPAKLNGLITYTMVVTNNGPDTATGVTVADPLPAGTSFVSVSTTQGTCANSNGLIQCSLGTIPKGGAVTVTLVVRAMRAGRLTNEVTVVGKEPESNTANNRATATTLVPTPLTPPKKPKPKPVCSTLTVGRKTLHVGKRSTITVNVKNRSKPVKGAKVLVRGAGIAKSGRTNASGKARIAVKPKRPGIVVVSVRQKLVCGAKRLGVVGVFEPPVTG
jgi:uncharacterized repeat protein (TIGR01451 family)